jgi:hypothetical protein
MKNFVVLFSCFLLFTGIKSFAQITITTSDVQAFLTPGHTLSLIEDTSTTSLNIGNTGATSWDFSSLSPSLVYTVSSVNPSGTPLGGHYPLATNAFYDTTTVSGYQLQTWLYFGINNALLNYGEAGQGSVGGFDITFLSHNNPAAKNIVLPLTYNTSWSEDYVKTDSTIISPLPTTVTTTNFHDDNVVDAYGTITFPGGAQMQALRVRTDTRQSSQGSYSRTISYLFLTTTGTQISVDAADTTSPNTGTIPVSDITFLNSGITDVRQANNTIPDKFNLAQNFPNPFNPTTNINYSIPSPQKVILKVYDELGREVTTLVNSDQTAGNYTVDFNASNLASGVYFYRLQAGNFIQMKKMILLR